MNGSSVGNRVRTQWQRPPIELVEKFRPLPTGVIGDAMSRLGAMNGQVRPLWPGAALLGAVLPVWVRTGDNLKIHHAMELARPGDVLVVNGQGSLAHGLFGELMAAVADNKGIVGIVVDGAVRDIARLKSLRFPAFGRGVCAAGPSKEGTGEIGYPVACGGVVCCGGDLVIGDSDGVVVVPFADLELVLKRAQEIAGLEDEWRIGVGRGVPLPVAHTWTIA
jgi:4-hydroxy-4-methyl-2-oxoglutarate aldolase